MTERTKGSEAIDSSTSDAGEPGDCPLCGKTSLDKLPFRYSFHDRYLYGVQCRGCGLVFVHPQPSPEEIAAMYDEEYFTENSDEVGAHGPRAYMEMAAEGSQERKAAASRMDARLRRYAPNRGRLLEIGCGPGFFLAELTALGWTGAGLELSAFAARHAREQLGLEVTHGGVAAGVFPPETFQALFMGDVLEHLPAPLEALRAIREWLVPGGVAAIAVPSTLNLVSAKLGMTAYRSLGRCKTLRLPPYHLFEYTPDTLRAMIEAAGLRVQSVEQSAVPIGKMGLRGSAAENIGKVSLQMLAHASSALLNRGGDRLLAIATR